MLSHGILPRIHTHATPTLHQGRDEGVELVGWAVKTPLITAPAYDDDVDNDDCDDGDDDAVVVIIAVKGSKHFFPHERGKQALCKNKTFCNLKQQPMYPTYPWGTQ